jgi:hypothetical protein
MTTGLYTPRIGTQMTQIAYDKIRFFRKKSYLIISNLRHLRSHFFAWCNQEEIHLEYYHKPKHYYNEKEIKLYHAD